MSCGGLFRTVFDGNPFPNALRILFVANPLDEEGMCLAPDMASGFDPTRKQKYVLELKIKSRKKNFAQTTNHELHTYLVTGGTRIF